MKKRQFPQLRAFAKRSTDTTGQAWTTVEFRRQLRLAHSEGLLSELLKEIAFQDRQAAVPLL
jgi:hypothetical protein